jgi:transcriptional regulator with XRE-family HTH domain
MTTTGDFICDKRKEKGWSRERLAREVNISVDYLYNIEKGHFDNNLIMIDKKLCVAIAIQLGFDLSAYPNNIG